jgi:hypothetical protein
MTDGRPPLLYPGPRAALLRRVRTLTVDDLHALDAAVRDLLAERVHRHVDKGYFFAWWDGPRLDEAGEDELHLLFGDVLVALAGGLTGLDVERVGAHFTQKRRGLDGLVDLFLRPRKTHQLQDASIGLIESALAPWDPRYAVVATWNVACAAALRRHLPDATVAALEAAWRRALGDPPA